jgi:hypothetical protein
LASASCANGDRRTRSLLALIVMSWLACWPASSALRRLSCSALIVAHAAE